MGSPFGAAKSNPENDTQTFFFFLGQVFFALPPLLSWRYLFTGFAETTEIGTNFPPPLAVRDFFSSFRDTPKIFHPAFLPISPSPSKFAVTTLRPRRSGAARRSS